MSILSQLRDEQQENVDNRSFHDRMTQECEWQKTLLVDGENHIVQKRKFFVGGSCHGITFMTLDDRDVYHGIGGFSFDYGIANGI